MKLTSVAIAIVAAALAACGTRTNPDFCCSDLTSCGNSGTGVGVTPCTDPTRPLCDDNGAAGPPRTCIADIGGQCTGPAECTNPERPFCIDNRCVQCEDDDPTNRCTNPTPACDLATHLCVGCDGPADCVGDPGGAACLDGSCVDCASSVDCTSAGLPVCDAVTHDCRACVADAECGTDGVCDRDSGACIAPIEILYVRAGATGSACTAADPCPTIAGALAIAGTRRTIKVAAGSYAEPTLRIATGRTIRIHGAGTTQTVINPTNSNQEILFADTGGDLTVVALTVSNASQKPGVACSGGRLTMRRVLVLNNTAGGLSLSSCAVDLVNNIIAQNGAPGAGFGGVSFLNIGAGNAIRFEHNTVVDNSAGTGNFGGITCSLVTPIVPLTASILYGNTGATQIGGSTNCTLSDSIMGPPLSGTRNSTEAPMLDPAFHLMAGSPAIDRLMDAPSTVFYDVDGEPRPAGAGRDCGADERP